MATALENLKIRRDNIAEYLASLTCGSSDGDLPTASGDGINPQTTDKIRQYTEELKSLNELIHDLELQTANDAGSVGIFATRVLPLALASMMLLSYQAFGQTSQSPIAHLSRAEGTFYVGAGSNQITTLVSSADARSLISAADYAAMKTLLAYGTMADQNANAVAITGGTIDGTAIGGTTRAAGAFSTLAAGTSSPSQVLHVVAPGGQIMQFGDVTAAQGLLKIIGGAERVFVATQSDGDANAYADWGLKVTSLSAITTGKPIDWYFSMRKDGYFSGDSSGPTLVFYSDKKDGGYLAPLCLTTTGNVILAGAQNATNGNVGIGERVPDYKLDANGTFGFSPGADSVPIDNGDVTLDFPTATTLRIRGKNGGTVRNLTLPISDSTALVASDVGVSVQAYDADLAALAGLSTANGDVLYYNSGWTRLAKGDDGQVLKLASGIPAWAADATGAGGSAITFDIGDDGGNDSVDVTEIATTGDTNAIFSEPSADKILIDLTKNWPTADAATTATTATTANAGDSATGFFADQNAGTDLTADLEEESHASEHAVGGADTVFPADPGADKILKWDDVPGTLVWADDTDTTYTAGDGLDLTGTTFSLDLKTGGGLEIDSTELTLTSTHLTGEIGITIDGAGSEIADGVKGFVRIPFACTITGVYLMADQTGSIVVDVWKDTFANYPPTVADTITASAKPTLSSAISGSDTTLTDWTKTVSAGDVIGFNVDSCTTIERLTLQITTTK